MWINLPFIRLKSSQNQMIVPSKQQVASKLESFWKSKLCTTRLQMTLQYLNDGKTFIRTSEQEWLQAIFTIISGWSLIRQITTGNWEVTRMLANRWYKQRKSIFFSSEVRDEPQFLGGCNRWMEKGKTSLTTSKETPTINMIRITGLHGLFSTTQSQWWWLNESEWKEIIKSAE